MIIVGDLMSNLNITLLLLLEITFNVYLQYFI